MNTLSLLNRRTKRTVVSVLFVDFEEEKIHPAIINKFVEKVVPTSNSSYIWYINLSGNTRAHANLTLNGKNENPIFKLEDIESGFPLQSREHGLICSNQVTFSTPTYDTLLQHRLQSKMRLQSNYYFNFAINYNCESLYLKKIRLPS